MKNTEFYQGFAVAVGTMAQTQPGVAVDVMDSCGIVLADLIKHGCDEFDLKPLRAEYKAQGRNLNGRLRKQIERRRQKVAREVEA